MLSAKKQQDFADAKEIVLTIEAGKSKRAHPTSPYTGYKQDNGRMFVIGDAEGDIEKPRIWFDVRPVQEVWGVPMSDRRREDVAMREQMFRGGWEDNYHEDDVRRFGIEVLKSGQQIPYHAPTEWHKGDLRVWMCYPKGWQVARLVDGKFCEHRGRVGYAAGVKYPDRFPDTRGYIPTLADVLHLSAEGTL